MSDSYVISHQLIKKKTHDEFNTHLNELAKEGINIQCGLSVKSDLSLNLGIASE